MKAMGFHEYGGPEVLEALELPEPEAGDGDVLIEVHACGMNPVDYKIRQGHLGTDRPKPVVLGYDVSGVVREVGPDVEGFKEGDEVYASPSLARNGSNAQYVAADYRTVGPKPSNLDPIDAAALPLVTLTAWESLHDHARLHPNETVLIHAGGGGVGHIAIQLAKIHGSKVLTTAGRDESIALCKKLGADVIINYHEQDLVDRVMDETDGKGCNVVFDTVGGDVFKQSMQCLSVDGRLVTIVGVPKNADIDQLKGKNASVHLEFMGSSTMNGVRPERQGQTLRTVSELVEAGKLTPHVSHTIPLELLASAHEQQECGHTLGKIVLEVQ